MKVAGLVWPLVFSVIMRRKPETHEGIAAGNTPANIDVRSNPGAQHAQERRCAAAFAALAALTGERGLILSIDGALLDFLAHETSEQVLH